MRLALSVLSFLSVLATAVAADAIEATMLAGRTYAVVTDCAKLKRLASGTPRSAATVPTTLTAKGYQRFDDTCHFTNISERYAGRLWTVTLACQSTSGETALRIEVWRKQTDGTLTVTTDKTAEALVACPEPTVSKRK